MTYDKPDNGPCYNCGEKFWATKNDRYYTHCEQDYMTAWWQTIADTPNPKQALADYIMETYNV
tara:strand:- start:171 stop:359 length:189 start_codon:yes stop_codon:yes gene_type:complete